jgi:predicted nucleic acid-binding Zn ribbon protein
MDCPVCAKPVPDGTRGQRRRYCSPNCRKRAELEARRLRKIEAFIDAFDGTIATRQDVLALLTAAARDGSVMAAKVLLEELRRDDVDQDPASSVIDELARRRT